MFCDSLPLPLQLLSKYHFFTFSKNGVDLCPPIWTISVNILCFSFDLIPYDVPAEVALPLTIDTRSQNKE